MDARVLKCVVLAAVSLAACGESQMTGELGGGSDTGEVVVELTSVPTAVRCIEIDLQRSPSDAPVEKTFSVLANASSANLAMGRLSLGFARFSGLAWDLDCADPNIVAAQPSWQSASVDTNVQLGLTTKVRLNFYANDPTTVDANFVKNVAEISTGLQETYARLADGTLWQWGALGGNVANISTVARPFALPTGLLAAKVVVGINFACAMMTSGTVSCWGFNSRGQVGPGVAINASTNTPTNVPLPTGNTAIDIAAGDAHVCALANTGSVMCWGANDFGQLGVDPASMPPPAMSATPVFAVNNSGARIYAGSRHNCVLSSGQIWCWGANDSGQLGNGVTSTGAQFFPIQLTVRGAVDLALGKAHTCALHSDGTVGCWGSNSNGQIGDGTTTTRLTEFKVFQANGPATAIMTGSSHTCMLSSTNPTALPDRILTCWGANGNGQLGDTTAIDKASPNPRFGVFALYGHNTDSTCIARTAPNLDIQCTGNNMFGQLGDGTRNTRFQFTSVTY